MKRLILLFLLSPTISFSQSPFDGTWLFTAQLPSQPAVYLLAKRMFRCSGCLPNTEIEADGNDHKVAEATYWDTVNLQIVDAHTLVFIAKKGGENDVHRGRCCFSGWSYTDSAGKRHDRSRDRHDRDSQSTSRQSTVRRSRSFGFMAGVPNQSFQKRFYHALQVHGRWV
jgi:hypothetical protein